MSALSRTGNLDGRALLNKIKQKAALIIRAAELAPSDPVDFEPQLAPLREKAEQASAEVTSELPMLCPPPPPPPLTTLQNHQRNQDPDKVKLCWDAVSPLSLPTS